MATAAPTPAQAELISSLTQDEIPIKLRCAICSRLAINAFRLPCCEQAICETCHSSLSSSCPVCEHTPIAAEDCKPHKSLRTTIKVFLRTEEKKREASRAKELKDTPPVTPIEPPVAEIAVETPAAAVEEPVETPAEEPAEDANAPAEENLELVNEHEQADSAPLEEQQDIPQQSVEEVPPGQESNEDATGADAFEGINEGDEKIGDDTTQITMPGTGNGFGFDAMAAGGFPNMGMNGAGDFNQMQMMMAMQNGMGPNGFGSFPMMGMPGMSMDPMAMQSMFMNGGFGGGMGMMGMGDFNGSMMGNNFNGGNWNSTQQTWNHGNQNNFNQANAVAGAHGDFGAAAHHQNFPAARGNFHQQYNDYSQNNGAYGWRGGRGGRGRGSYGGRGNFHGNFGEQTMPNHFGSGGANIPSDVAIPTGPKADSATNVDEFGREARTTSEKPLDPHDSGDAAQDQQAAATESTDPHTEQAAFIQDGNGARPIQTLDEAEATPYDHGYAQDFSHNNPYAYQGRNWHNGYNPMPPPVVPDVPVNAPTGPKAMREGNMNMRGRGFSIVGRGGARLHGSIVQEVHTERSTSRTAEPEREKEKSRSRSKSPRKEEDRASEAGSRRERRRHRHRSNSPSEDSEERERRRERRRRRERKYEDDQEVYDGEKEDSKTREASPAESRRSSHRSRRDRDKERERDRDHKSSRSHRSSHRSHRDRSRDRSREYRSRRHHDEDDATSVVDVDTKGDEDKGSSSNRRGERERDRDRDTRDKDRDRDRDRESKSGREREDRDKDRDRSSRHSRSHRDEDRSSRHGTSHRERSDRESDRDRARRKESDRDRERDRESSSSKVAPAADPHTLEREARNRERLLKEAQRIAGLASIAGIRSKRGRDEHEGGSGRRSKHRRRSGGLSYDGVGDEPDEERIARGESKRESSRWE